MTSQKVYAHNVLTDVVRLVPAHYLTHPTLGANLRAVRNGKKRGRLSEIIQDEPDSTSESLASFEDVDTAPINLDEKDN